MFKNEKCTCISSKTIVFHCQTCKFVTFIVAVVVMVAKLPNKRGSELSLSWHEWFSCKKQRMKALLPRALVAVRTSKMKISRRRLASYVEKVHEKACCTRSTIIFLRSTNQIIDLWRCRCRCCRHFLNSLSFWSSTDAFHLIQAFPQKQGEAILAACTCWEDSKTLRFLVAVQNSQVKGASVQI